MRFIKGTALALTALLLTGTKGCEVKSKEDVLNAKAVITAVPEIAKLANKFEIQKYTKMIRLTTYDNFTFREAIAILKTTSMDKPVLFRKNNVGTLKIELTESNIHDKIHSDIYYYYDEERPYKGLIYLFDGWWRAIEIDASPMFVSKNTDTGLQIFVTEFCYANAAVHKLNSENGSMSIMSMIDSRKGDGSIKGDGSTPDTVISEFDK